MLRSNKQFITSKAKHSQISFIFTKARSRLYLKQMHVHVNAQFTSLTYALMHGHILCMLMAKQGKHKEGNPNLTC